MFEVGQNSLSNKRKGEGAQGMCFYHCNIKRQKYKKIFREDRRAFNYTTKMGWSALLSPSRASSGNFINTAQSL